MFRHLLLNDPYIALRSRGFQLLLAANFLSVVASQMLGVALGWELYIRTGSPLALGMIGLVEVIPVVALALPAGHVADRFDRKRVATLSMVVLAAASLGLAALSWTHGSLALIYLCVFFVGVARAFQSPATSALLAQVVRPEHFTSAATWQSSAWQASTVIGPTLGGLLVAGLGGASLVYVIVAALVLVVAILLWRLRPRPVERSAEPLSLDSLLAGLRFVRATRVILAAITLDMFAVLLGGATALLPIYARDILHVGAAGLGVLRSAPPVGAIVAAVIIAHRPPFQRAGRTLLLVVGGFGLATVVFGASRTFWLSLAMLALLGGLDNVSVVIRNTLVLTRTPDVMRGRVNAVHYVFLGLSNELGAFESGALASLIGVMPAVVAGGIGTMLVVGAVSVGWPEVRWLGKLGPEELPIRPTTETFEKSECG